MKTGTANYLSLVVDELTAYPAITECATIVVDNDFLPEPVASYRGIAVRDHRTLPGVVGASDFAFMFIANNIFHGYVARALSRLSVVEKARVVTVVHEPCTYMLLNKLSGDGIQTFGRAEQTACVATQYGIKAEKILSDLEAGHLPPAVEFQSIGLDYHLRASSEVWCHSAFAISKLILESTISPADMPRFRLVTHPLYRLESTVTASARLTYEKSRKKGFRIGLFGWCSPSKMIAEFLQGYSLFLDRRDQIELENIELIIVGQMYSESVYPLRAEISRLDLSDYVRSFDYVDDDTFGALVRTCDLIGNLRYPSCGETSGTLSHAHESGAQIVTSRYQSFAEEIADYRLPVLRPLQPALIAGAIETCYRRWASGSGRPSESVEFAARQAPYLGAGASKLVALRCMQFLAAEGL